MSDTHLTLVTTTALPFYIFFFQAEDGIRDLTVTGVQTCALPIYASTARLLAGSGDAQWMRSLRGPHLGALAAGAAEDLAAHRICGAARDHAPVFLCADGAAEDGNPVGIVGGAVQRIDDEAHVAAAVRPAFLG